MDHARAAEPLELRHPVPFQGKEAVSLTLGNLYSPAVESGMRRAARTRDPRQQMVIAVASATECPVALISKLSTDDLIRAADWVADAFLAAQEELLKCRG